MMNQMRFLLLLISIGLIPSLALTQEKSSKPEVFSGPQAGETLPNFKMKVAIGPNAGSEMDLVEKAQDKPLVIVFLHKRSRPAFGLANAIMRYCNQKGGDNLNRAICMLTADPTDTANWMNKVKRYFPANTPVGYSTEGIEGPGAYGLNRNVELTILIGKQKKVTNNFALVQPGAHVDGPKILDAIAAATGAKRKPDINQYLPSNQAAQDAPIAIDPRLLKQVKIINDKDSTHDEIGKAIADIEKMIDGKKALQNQLGTLVARWVKGNRIESIGNEEHQKKLQKWAREFASKMSRGRQPGNRGQANRRTMDPQFSNLLRAVIQKSNSDEQVDTAAKKVEEYIKENKEAKKELARIANTIANSDRLSNYGTPRAQEVLKRWAKEFPYKK